MVDEQAIKEALHTKARQHPVARAVLLERILLSVPDKGGRPGAPSHTLSLWERLHLGRKLEVLAACVLLAGLLVIVAAKQHRFAPTGSDKNPPSEAVTIPTEQGWRRSKPESMTNIRITDQGMELGPETSTPTMWAQGFHRVGMILAEPIDLGQPTSQVIVRFDAIRPLDTYFSILLRGSLDKVNWTEWSDVQFSGGVARLPSDSRYAQYWIHLAANEPTPIVKDVALKPIYPEGGGARIASPINTDIEFYPNHKGQSGPNEVKSAYVPGGPKLPNFPLTNDGILRVVAMLRAVQFAGEAVLPPPPPLGDGSNLVIELAQGDVMTVHMDGCATAISQDGSHGTCRKTEEFNWVYITRQGHTGRFRADELVNWLSSGAWQQDVTGLH